MKLWAEIRSYRALKFWNRHAATSVVMNNEIPTATAIHVEEVTAAVQSGSELPIKEVYLPPKFQQPGSMVAEIDANSPKELDFKLWSEGR